MAKNIATKSDKAMEAKWRAEDDLRTMTNHAEIMADKKRMQAAMKMAEEKAKEAAKVAAKLKSKGKK